MAKHTPRLMAFLNSHFEPVTGIAHIWLEFEEINNTTLPNNQADAKFANSSSYYDLRFIGHINNHCFNQSVHGELGYVLFSTPNPICLAELKLYEATLSSIENNVSLIIQNHGKAQNFTDQAIQIMDALNIECLSKLDAKCKRYTHYRDEARNVFINNYIFKLLRTMHRQKKPETSLAPALKLDKSPSKKNASRMIACLESDYDAAAGKGNVWLSLAEVYNRALPDNTFDIVFTEPSEFDELCLLGCIKRPDEVESQHVVTSVQDCVLGYSFARTFNPLSSKELKRYIDILSPLEKERYHSRQHDGQATTFTGQALQIMDILNICNLSVVQKNSLKHYGGKARENAIQSYLYNLLANS